MHSTLKPPLGLLAAALLCLDATACGSTSTSIETASRSSSNSATRAAATTSQGEAAPRRDENYSEVLDFGHTADPADKRAVTDLVTRYYKAAAAEDGVTACSLLVPSIAKSVPEDYGQAPGPTYMRGGKTCPAVMDKLFAYLHKLLTTEAASLTVTRVRLKTRGGYAVLQFTKTTPERELTIVHQDDNWKISSLLDSKLF